MRALELCLQDARDAFRRAADASAVADIERHASAGRNALRLAQHAAASALVGAKAIESRPSFWAEIGSKS